MKFEDKYFNEYRFTQEQIKKNFDNALRDLRIAKEDKILEVKFNYAYNALIKAGIALLSFHRVKVRSVQGHHVKIIEKMAEILNEEDITEMGNLMRSKRNLDFYGGGTEITGKECAEFINFSESVLLKVEAFISK